MRAWASRHSNHNPVVTAISAQPSGYNSAVATIRASASQNRPAATSAASCAVSNGIANARGVAEAISSYCHADHASRIALRAAASLRRQSTRPSQNVAAASHTVRSSGSTLLATIASTGSVASQ